jgi:hypothetical protein
VVTATARAAAWITKIRPNSQSEWSFARANFRYVFKKRATQVARFFVVRPGRAHLLDDEHEGKDNM